MSAPGLSK